MKKLAVLLGIIILCLNLFAQSNSNQTITTTNNCIIELSNLSNFIYFSPENIKRTCRLIEFSKNYKLLWSGECKNGFANGRGTLSLRKNNQQQTIILQYEGTIKGDIPEMGKK